MMYLNRSKMLLMLKLTLHHLRQQEKLHSNKNNNNRTIHLPFLPCSASQAILRTNKKRSKKKKRRRKPNLRNSRSLHSSHLVVSLLCLVLVVLVSKTRNKNRKLKKSKRRRYSLQLNMYNHLVYPQCSESPTTNNNNKLLSPRAISLKNR